MGYSIAPMGEPFKNQLRKWRGNRIQKEGASLLNVPVATFRKWEYGKRTPNKLAMAEIKRRMEGIL